jgi:tRNA pseudouridine38-40 synthase
VTKTSREAEAPRRTLRLDLEYDGTDFVGWQIQSRGRSVQGELRRALSRLLQEETTPVGSGRTDAGTHALGQVAHVHTASRLGAETIHRGLNSLLPPDIAVTACREVGDDFHARYSALSKRYRYRIATARPALERRFVWPLYRQLDLDRLSEAASLLTGTHHFAAFCKQDPQPERYDCQVLGSGWRRRGPELVYEVEANRFLRHMVRILVGTMVEVGLGQRPVSSLPPLLTPCTGAEARERRALAGPTVPARGLCLVSLTYPGD